ncbi:hypothetical protein [Mycolicibacterium komossense]|uniref:Uncharacterized protein n=1 Tax=Mycolicibacterium komossense TaxID=1779 RepID=A0ABT3CKQ6_9MYCO|nr:hypothetical protein [Mycolicibacterium komossense]MCV7230021.1 hypothetical protein [Mycolicibacterium komossense]
MSITQYRATIKRARERRRLYARIGSLPDSTFRKELLAIAQRHEGENR